jgi:hypothetical protein
MMGSLLGMGACGGVLAVVCCRLGGASPKDKNDQALAVNDTITTFDEKPNLEDLLPADSRTLVALNQLCGPAFNQVLSIVKDDKKVKLCMLLCERIYALRYDLQQEVFPRIPLCINQIQVREYIWRIVYVLMTF